MTNTTVNAPAPMMGTGNKINVALRYLGSNATGGLTVFVVLGMLTPDQQVEILKSAHQMYDASYAFVGAAANIWYIVFPIIAVWLGKLGVNSSGFGAMMDRVFAAAKSGNKEAQVVIAAATANDPATLAQVIKQMPGVEALVVNKNATPELAAAALSPENNKIVAAPGQGPALEAVVNSAG